MTFFTVVPMDFTIEMVKYDIFMDIRATLATLPMRILKYFSCNYENCLRINDFMQGMFRGVGIKLVDFKLEFGTANIDGKTEILLADEISPDTCRLWDVVSEKKLDKDRFRKDLGNIIQAYQEVARRLGIIHEEANISEVRFGKPKEVNIKKK